MDLKFKVCLEYLQKQAAMTIPQEMVSKEDKAKQTAAVEKLIKDVINTKLPGYKNKVFSVGGHVRDQLLGKQSKDLDAVVDDPEHKMKSAEVFAKELTDALGITTANNPHPLKEEYGIWGVVLFNPRGPGGSREPFIYDGVDVTGYVVELTPPRKEGPYDYKKREPKYVEYTSREEDAKRRDLTINAIYKNIATGEIEDHVGGLEDLKEKKLQPPKHPEGMQKIYEEDPLRILRLIRFQGKLGGFDIDSETEATVKRFLASSEGQRAMNEKLSRERIRDEFVNILTHPDASTAVRGLEALKDFGLLGYISPELEKLTDMYHDTVTHKGESVWEHTVDVLKRTPSSLKARLGALFHDIGKLETMEQKTDPSGRERVHFIGHEDKGSKMVNKILQDLKFPISIAKSVSDIVHGHMGFKDIEQQKPATQLKHIRMFIEKLYDDLEDAIALLKADAKRDPQNIQKVNEIEQRIKDQIKDDIQKGLLVEKQKGMGYIDPLSGDEIQQEFEEIKGEGLGAVKNKLKRMLLEGRFENMDAKNRAERAKQLIKQFAANEQQLQAAINKYRKERKSEKFFKAS